MQIGLLTHLELPELDSDDRLLRQELLRRGYSAVPVAWDDPTVSWSQFDVVLVRSPWNYYLDPTRFFAWIQAVSVCTRLENSPPVLQWNLDKRYLLELARIEVAIVPTAILERGSNPESADLSRWAHPHGLILKPAISADSFATLFVPPGELERAQGHLARWLPERSFLCQPYLPTVEDPGEHCLVLFDGVFSHAVRKNALTRGGRWGNLPEGVAIETTPQERQAAEGIVKAATDLLGLERPPLYARVDLLPGGDGAPLLLELELAEPTLFFGTAPGSAARFCDLLEERLRV